MVAPNTRTIGKKESEIMFLTERARRSLVAHCESYKRCWNISLENQFPPSPNLYSKTFRNLQMSDINTSRLPQFHTPAYPSVDGADDRTLTRGER